LTFILFILTRVMLGLFFPSSADTDVE